MCGRPSATQQKSADLQQLTGNTSVRESYSLSTVVDRQCRHSYLLFEIQSHQQKSLSNRIYLFVLWGKLFKVESKLQWHTIKKNIGLFDGLRLWCSVTFCVYRCSLTAHTHLTLPFRAGVLPPSAEASSWPNVHPRINPKVIETFYRFLENWEGCSSVVLGHLVLRNTFQRIHTVSQRWHNSSLKDVGRCLLLLHRVDSGHNRSSILLNKVRCRFNVSCPVICRLITVHLLKLQVPYHAVNIIYN